MCHSDASRPPAAEGAVPAGSERPVELRASDGTRVLAHQARAVAPSGVGIVVLPDVRGLHDYYRQLAVVVAETGAEAGAGAEAVAVDDVGRTAPDDDRSEAFAFMPQVSQTTPEGVGGSSWRRSADPPGLAGAIGCYGRPQTAAEGADRRSAPLLLLVAGADAHIPVQDLREGAETARRRVPAGRRIAMFVAGKD